MVKLFKYLILSLLCVQASLASERVIKYEDFIHFSHIQKVETLKLVHTFLIEYENTDIDLLKKQKNKAKYQTYKKIFNFFINSAYASNSGVEFSRDELNANQLCYYAGWISTRKIVNGSPVCLHPKDINRHLTQAGSSISRENRRFLTRVSRRYSSSVNQSPVTLRIDSTTGFSFDSSANSCNPNGGDIICNPTIFGLKSGSSICVPGNISLGLNSSLLCNQALNLIKEENPEEYAVTIQGILNNATGVNKDEFFLTLDAMYDTCLCGKDASRPANGGRFRGSLDARYAEILFNQRACFGIINQTEHIYEALSELPQNSATCSAFAQTPLNRNNEGVNWLSYLNQAYQKIQEQDIQAELANLISMQRQTLDQSISENERESIRASEEQLVSQMRDQHFEEYIEAGLCPANSSRTGDDQSEDTDGQNPIADGDGNGSDDSSSDGDGDDSDVSITSSIDDGTNDSSSDGSGDGSDVSPTSSIDDGATDGDRTDGSSSNGSNFSIISSAVDDGSDPISGGPTTIPGGSTTIPGTVIPLRETAADGTEAPDSPDSPETPETPETPPPTGYSLTIEKVGAGSSDLNPNIVMINATITRTGNPFTDSEADIAILNSINLQIVRNEATDTDTTQNLQVEVFNNGDDESNTQPITQQTDTATTEPATTPPLIQNGTHTKTFKVTRQINILVIKGIAIAEGTTFASNNTETIEGSGAPETEAEPVVEETATATSSNDRCSVIIEKENKGNNIVKLRAKITFVDEDGESSAYPDAEGALPDSTSITWYKTTVENEAPANRTRARNTLSSDEDEEESSESETSEDSDTTASTLEGLSIIPDSQGEGEENYVSWEITKGPQAQKAGVKIEIGDICKVAQKVDIPAANAPVAPNDKPYQIPSRMTPAPQGGGILGGQR